MNDNQNLNGGNGTYKSVGNLNTAIENPNIDVDSVTGVNIQNSSEDFASPQNFMGADSYINSESSSSIYSDSQYNVNINKSEEINNNYDNQNVSFDNLNNESLNNSNVNNNINVDNNSNINTNSNTDFSNNNGKSVNSVNYNPVYTKKNEKNSDVKIAVSKELKLLIFIVFILVLVILSLPYIYDFVNNIILWIVNKTHR